MWLNTGKMRTRRGSQVIHSSPDSSEDRSSGYVIIYVIILITAFLILGTVVLSVATAGYSFSKQYVYRQNAENAAYACVDMSLQKLKADQDMINIPQSLYSNQNVFSGGVAAKCTSYFVNGSTSDVRILYVVVSVTRFTGDTNPVIYKAISTLQVDSDNNRFVTIDYQQASAADTFPAVPVPPVVCSTPMGWVTKTYNNNDSFVIPKCKADIQYTIVAGGGGGGAGNISAGGGGGGGQVKTGSTTLNAGTYNVTVGAGGAAGTNGLAGGDGDNSSITGVASSTGGTGGQPGVSAGPGGNGGAGGVTPGCLGADYNYSGYHIGAGGGGGGTAGSCTVASGTTGGSGAPAINGYSGGGSGAGVAAPISTSSCVHGVKSNVPGGGGGGGISVLCVLLGGMNVALSTGDAGQNGVVVIKYQQYQ